MRSRRFFYWYLPLSLSILCAVTFAWGFSLLFRDDIGIALTEAVASVEERTDVGGPLKIVLLGDSVARGTGDASGEGIGGNLGQALREREVEFEEPLNLAVNGARSADLVAQIDETPSIRGFIANADVIVISIGGNDLWGDRALRQDDSPPDPETAMDRVEGDVVSAIRRVRSINPEARVFYVGLYNPFRETKTPFSDIVDIAVGEWQARLVREFSDDAKVTIVQTYDIFSHNDRLSADRFHPGVDGYRLIGRRIGESI